MRSDSTEKSGDLKRDNRTIKPVSGKASRGTSADSSREKKRGRRAIGGAKKGPNKGEAKTIQLKIDPLEFNHIRDLLREDDPGVVERTLGFEFDRDLLIRWPEKGHKKTQSGRAACILEALARRGKETHEKA